MPLNEDEVDQVVAELGASPRPATAHPRSQLMSRLHREYLTSAAW
jgi:hypothetical protein